MQICIFEDKETSNFYPLTYSRPVYDLLSGYLSLKEKIISALPKHKIIFHSRDYLSGINSYSNNASFENSGCVFINGRVITDKNFSKLFTRKKKDNVVFVNNNTVIAAFLHGAELKSFLGNKKDLLSIEDFDGLPAEETGTETVRFTWDLINNNGKELLKDFENIFNRKKRKNQDNISGKIFPGVHLVSKKEIIIEKGAVIKPGVVIDASNGPVYIDKDAEIFPNAVIEGPVYIGESVKIKSGSSIYENTTIGKVCKIGGEVECSLIMPYSNKQHAGFLGHSYLGSWVNLGADTNNSDLKNNYSTVKVYLNGKMIDTGSQFMGLIMGDHSKSGINTMFNTGTVAGFSCNVFGAGFPGKFIPSFTWGGVGKSETYSLEKSIAAAKIVMQRRNKIMSKDEENIFRSIFEQTENERKAVV